MKDTKTLVHRLFGSIKENFLEVFVRSFMCMAAILSYDWTVDQPTQLFRRKTCFCVELVKLLPVNWYNVDIYHILVLQEYWVLTDSRIPLNPVLGAWELLHFPLFLISDSIKPSLLFSNIVGSLYFWRICFSRLFENVYWKIVSEYDQEIPQSQTADNPMAPRGRATQPSRDTRKTT